MRLVPLLAAALALAASPAAATSFNLAASHDGAQETPPVVTAGTGSMSITYDDVTNLLTWTGSFSGLTGTTTDAHFHGPAAPGAGPAGVQVATNAGSGDIFPLGVTSGAFSGSASITATQGADLLAGLWYHNIHSTFKTGGEIRGQVLLVPEATTFGLLVLGLAGLGWTGRRKI